jgi:hypothetical protein
VLKTSKAKWKSKVVYFWNEVGIKEYKKVNFSEKPV